LIREDVQGSVEMIDRVKGSYPGAFSTRKQISSGETKNENVDIAGGDGTHVGEEGHPNEVLQPGESNPGNDAGDKYLSPLVVGSTMALTGKCASPDYGTRLFYIKNKHTGSGKMAGILRRIGEMHSMEAVDPPKNGNGFKDQVDFHRVAQGRCVDLLVAHTKRAPWVDKAFKGALKFTSVRDPVQRAVSAYRHSLECGKHCAMCWKLLSEPLRWARQCGDVQDAQLLLARGNPEEDAEQVVEDYDLVLVTERYFESLVVLRHILGVALVEVLFVSEKGEPQDGVPVSLAHEPRRFLDLLKQRNPNDTTFHEAANIALDDKIRIIGSKTVSREVLELRRMQALLQATCANGERARSLMGSPFYSANKDCLWHDQGCGHKCITQWAATYEAARLNRISEQISV